MVIKILEDVLNERLHKNSVCYIYRGPSLFNENTYILQGKLTECAKSMDVNTSYRNRNVSPEGLLCLR